MISRRSCCLLFPVLLCCPAFSSSRAAPPVEKEKFHLYLLIGQSNMAGRGIVVTEENGPPERVLKFTKENTWAPAVEPLHFDKTIAGVGLGRSFGEAMAKAEPGVTIGLIPCAVGGTPLDRWLSGGDLYQAALTRAKLAAKDGVIKGILWHQGENDAGKKETADSYLTRLTAAVASWRKDLDAPDLPFVAGKLGEFLATEYQGKPSYWKLINAQLDDLPGTVAHSAVADSSGLTAKSDHVHFDTPALREFGRRYAEKMSLLLKAK